MLIRGDETNLLSSPSQNIQLYINNQSQPPIPAEEFKIDAKLPDLTVEGDVMLKEFDFIVDNKIDKPVKLARVRICCVYFDSWCHIIFNFRQFMIFRN